MRGHKIKKDILTNWFGLLPHPQNLRDIALRELKDMSRNYSYVFNQSKVLWSLSGIDKLVVESNEIRRDGGKAIFLAHQAHYTR